MAKPQADGARFGRAAAVGVPQVAGPFNKFEMHSTPRFQIGYKVEDANGNVYRYAHFSANTNRGVLVSPDISETGLDDTDNMVTLASAVQTAGDNALGSRYVEMNVSALASVLLNDYAGGRLVITDDTGEGYTYDVLGNTAKGDPAADLVRVTLVQKLQVGLDNTSDVAISPNLYSNLEISTTTDVYCVGVTCSTIVVATAPYGWIQQKGDVGILQDGAIAVGQPVQLSDGTAGAVQIFGGAVASAVAAADLTTEPIIGYCVLAGDSTGHGIFNVNL